MRALSFYDQRKIRYLIYQVYEAGDKPTLFISLLLVLS
ncbi:hypothetical protein GHAL_0408 [Hafnia alvei ATCC 13337]|uniref:Uncharacterized protein n=1 Tax=Hafnia alvei ATCC 13337 TaxID=910996 RepID=A0ABD3ZLJ5_HAFAL|nr:hypothetical protein GHAL_0408 [Hafnia alvei ATCC 13337]